MTAASASNINNYYLLFQNSMGILNLLLWICNNFPAKAIVNNIYQLKCHFLNTMKQTPNTNYKENNTTTTCCYGNFALQVRSCCIFSSFLLAFKHACQ